MIDRKPVMFSAPATPEALDDDALDQLFNGLWDIAEQQLTLDLTPEDRSGLTLARAHLALYGRPLARGLTDPVARFNLWHTIVAAVRLGSHFHSESAQKSIGRERTQGMRTAPGPKRDHQEKVRDAIDHELTDWAPQTSKQCTEKVAAIAAALGSQGLGADSATIRRRLKHHHKWIDKQTDRRHTD